MTFFEKLIYIINDFTMARPNSFGWFHLIWLFGSIGVVILLTVKKPRDPAKRLRAVLLFYGYFALALEITKQILFAFHFENGVVTWDYQWYAAPFQLCTTPMLVACVAGFMKDSPARKALLSYIAFFTVAASIAVAFYPNDIFTTSVEVNVHTMFLHFGALTVSLYLLTGGYVLPTFKNFRHGFIVLTGFVVFAELLNVLIYKSGILESGDVFNMFYISPFFPSTLPVFSVIWPLVPIQVFVLLYLLVFLAGGGIVYLIARIVYNIQHKHHTSTVE